MMKFFNRSPLRGLRLAQRARFYRQVAPMGLNQLIDFNYVFLQTDCSDNRSPLRGLCLDQPCRFYRQVAPMGLIATRINSVNDDEIF